MTKRKSIHILLLLLSILFGFNVADSIAADMGKLHGTGAVSSNKELPKIGPRMSIALLALEGDPSATAFLQMMDDYLLAALLGGKRFQIIEREKTAQVVKEQKLVREKLAGKEQSIRLGKLVAADLLLSTTVRISQSSTEAHCRITVTGTSETFELEAHVDGTDRMAFKELAKTLAGKISRLFPMAAGVVTGKKQQTIRTDIGSASGVHPGMEAIFYRPGKTLTHPLTGKVIGRETVRLGEGYFLEVVEASSTISLTHSEPGLKIQPGDQVITK